VNKLVNKLAILIFLILAILSYNSCAADSEHWNDMGISHKFNKDISLAFSNRLKFEDIPCSNIYIASGKLGWGYATEWNLTVTPSYRIDWIDRKAKEAYEHRYSLQFDYKIPTRGIKTTITQITELRYFTESSEDHVRLRLRMNMSKDIGKPGNFPMTFYVMPEIFYDDISDEISRLRIYAGFDIKLRNDLSLRLGYILQNEKDRPDVHLFNTGLSLNI
jgi:hypothetical protein